MPVNITLSFYLTPVKIPKNAKKKKLTTNVVEDVGKGNPHSSLMGLQVSVATPEISDWDSER